MNTLILRLHQNAAIAAAGLSAAFRGQSGRRRADGILRVRGSADRAQDVWVRLASMCHDAVILTDDCRD
jgi:hypothetical protein